MGWTCVKTAGPLTPPCRYQMAHDIAGSKLYVHGGGGQGSATEQRRSLLWSLDLQTLEWTELDGPRKSRVTSRLNHTLTYCGGQLVVFGGKGEGSKRVDIVRERKQDASAAGAGDHAPIVRMLTLRNVLNDVAVFHLKTKTWRLLPISGKWPTPRRGHTATLVKHSATLEEAMTAAAKKEQARAANVLQHASGPASALDAVLEEQESRSKFVVVIGGAGPDVGSKGFETVLGQIWAFDPAEERWADLSRFCSGAPPPARFEHTANRLGRHIVIIGGLSATVNGSETLGLTTVLVWNVDTLVWSAIPTSHSASDSPALHGHATCRSPNSDEFLVFGGSTKDSEVRVLKLYGDAMDLCTWRTVNLVGRHAGCHGANNPFGRKLESRGARDRNGPYVPPGGSFGANAFSPHKVLGSGAKPAAPRGSSRQPKAPPRAPTPPPPADVVTCAPPEPRRGHLFSLFVPKSHSKQTFVQPAVLCFGGSLFHNGAQHLADGALYVFDPHLAREQVDHRYAEPSDVDSVFAAATVGANLNRFRKFTLDAARCHTPLGAKAEKAFVQTIRSDLQRSSSSTSLGGHDSYSYNGVKKLLQSAHKERLKLKPPPPDHSVASSVASSAASSQKVLHTMLNHDHHALSNMQHDIHDIQSTVKHGKNAFQRTHDAESNLAHSHSLEHLPNIKNLPKSFKQLHSSCSAQDLVRIKAINARTHSKSIARKMWYEHAEPHPLAHLLPPDLQVWL